MNNFSSKIRTAGALNFVLLVLFSMVVSAQEEIPITTKSAEAREIFLEARQQFDKARLVEARELFAKAIENDPDFALAHFYSALTALSYVNFHDHVKHATALKHRISDGERLLIGYLEAEDTNNPVKAIQILEKLVLKFPEDKFGRYFLGGAYFGSLNNYDKAIIELEKALAMDKNFAPAYNILGYSWRNKGEYAKAESAFKTYISLIPDEANPYDSLADLYAKMGRHADAIKSYEKAVELNTTFGISQKKIGDNLTFMGKYDEGREAYRKAMEMHTTPEEKLYDMDAIARSYIYEGKIPQALVENEKTVQMAGKKGLPEWEMQIYLNNCAIYTEIGSLDKAEYSLIAGHRIIMTSDLSPFLNEKFARVRLYYEALIAAKRKNFADAQARAEKYNEKVAAGNDPTLIENYHLLLGQIHSEKGEYEKALVELRQADPENPMALYLQAVAELKAGDKATSAELFKTVANWNEDSLNYALVRGKAKTAME